MEGTLETIRAFGGGIWVLHETVIHSWPQSHLVRPFVCVWSRENPTTLRIFPLPKFEIFLFLFWCPFCVFSCLLKAPCIDNFLPWEVVPCSLKRDSIYELDPDGDAYDNVYELRKVVKQFLSECPLRLSITPRPLMASILEMRVLGYVIGKYMLRARLPWAVKSTTMFVAGDYELLTNSKGIKLYTGTGWRFRWFPLIQGRYN